MGVGVGVAGGRVGLGRGVGVGVAVGVTIGVSEMFALRTSGAVLSGESIGGSVLAKKYNPIRVTEEPTRKEPRKYLGDTG